MSSFVEVDKKGLAKVLARRGIEFVVHELIQNALDEAGVTKIDVEIEKLGRGWARVVVSDDAPEGFKDIRHAYTLFAESYKKGDATRRGRYNMGDKLVVAVCRRARITTTTGSVIWEGEKRTSGRKRTEAGSVFEGEVPLSEAADYSRLVEAVSAVICPEHIKLRLNGNRVRARSPFRVLVDVNLPTEIGPELRRTRRGTDLALYEPRPGEPARIFEMGIPVVEIDCAWHIDVGQKVPLNMDRDNVTPAYLRELRTKVLNATHDALPEEHAAAPWVSDALGSKDIEPEAVKTVIVARHGEKAVIADPSDREAEGISVTRGYQVVHGGSYSAEQWGNIKAAEALLPAGQVNPSPKPFHPDGKPLKIVERKDWTPGLEETASYVRKVSGLAIGIEVNVVFANDPKWGFAGAYGMGEITINMARLGRAVLENAPNERLDNLLIHELAHEKAPNHLSEDFYDECTRIGARLMTALRQGDLA